MKLTKILLLGFALFAFSCSDMSDFEPVQPTVYAEYISLPEGTDVNNPSKEDYEIGFSALYRFKVYEDENGLYATDILSPREVNVSEEVFTIVLRIIDNTNRRLLEEAGCERNISLTRSGEQKNDCVARAISSATGLPYMDVNDYIVSECGKDGVPEKYFNRIFNHFKLYKLHDVDYYIGNETDLKQTVVIYKGPKTNGLHAVNGNHINSVGSMFCRDNQREDFEVVAREQIRYIFQYDPNIP